MSKESVVLLVITWLYCVVSIVQFIQHKQNIAELLREEKNIADQLLEKIKKEIELKKIIIDSKETKENYFKTLERIEKELFKQ